MVVCLELGADLHMVQLMPLPLTGSCAKHSTLESYMVFICQQSYLLLFGDHPLTLSLQA